MRYEIRLAGSGGQGLLLAGIILAEALSLDKSKYVVQTESFGPEARGGASRSDIIFSDKEIFYPKTRSLDLLLALSQKACDEYCRDVSPEGIIIVDDYYVKRAPKRAISFPFSSTSKENFGSERFANIISLGVIAAITKIVSINELAFILPSRVPPDTLESNIKAIYLGFELGKEWHLKNFGLRSGLVR